MFFTPTIGDLAKRPIKRESSNRDQFSHLVNMQFLQCNQREFSQSVNIRFPQCNERESSPVPSSLRGESGPVLLSLTYEFSPASLSLRYEFSPGSSDFTATQTNSYSTLSSTTLESEGESPSKFSVTWDQESTISTK